MKIIFQTLFILTYLLTIMTDSLAFSSEEKLPEAEEQRARNLFMQVKCLICEGQVIADSDTQTAYNLRKLIRTKIVENKSDKEIKAYLISQYGQNIITAPPLNFSTFLLWFLPIIFIISGMVVILRLVMFKKIPNK